MFLSGSAPTILQTGKAVRQQLVVLSRPGCSLRYCEEVGFGGASPQGPRCRTAAPLLARRDWRLQEERLAGGGRVPIRRQEDPAKGQVLIVHSSCVPWG
jgi:hypothetical protein